MDSLRTGTTYSCVIVAPLALSPIAALFIADVVTRVVHRAKDRAAEKGFFLPLTIKLGGAARVMDSERAKPSP